MKKIFLGLSLVALLAGCASHESSAGGTSDQYNQSQSGDQSGNGNYTSPTQGTGASSMTQSNNATGTQQ